MNRRTRAMGYYMLKVLASAVLLVLLSEAASTAQ